MRLSNSGTPRPLRYEWAARAFVCLVVAAGVARLYGCDQGDPIGVAPTSDFAATPRTGRAPLQVQFEDRSLPGNRAVTGWTWSFGDGQTSSERNPIHVYAESGSFGVTLEVRNSAGSSVETKEAYVVVGPRPMSVAFDATPRTGIVPLAVQFTDQSYPGAQPVFRRAWRFGDGDSSSVENPTHVYDTPGSYAVSLHLRTAAESTTVTAPDYIVVSPVPVAPTAAFDFSPHDGRAPLDVTFTDLSNPGTSTITSWSWSFGDGGASSVRNPVHHYTGGGSYEVSLTVTTDVGSDTGTEAVEVLPEGGPTASFSASPLSGDVPLLVNFGDLSDPGSAPITSWRWLFGDGDSSMAQNPSHLYDASGTYDVTLTVTTSIAANAETKSGYVDVLCPPAVGGISLGEDVVWTASSSAEGFNFAESLCPINRTGTGAAACRADSSGRAEVRASAGGGSASAGHAESSAEVGREFTIVANCTDGKTATGSFQLRYRYHGYTYLYLVGDPQCIEIRAVVRNVTMGIDVAEAEILARCTSAQGYTYYTETGGVTDPIPVTLAVGDTYRVTLRVYATSHVTSGFGAGASVDFHALNPSDTNLLILDAIELTY